MWKYTYVGEIRLDTFYSMIYLCFNCAKSEWRNLNIYLKNSKVRRGGSGNKNISIQIKQTLNIYIVNGNKIWQMITGFWLGVLVRIGSPKATEKRRIFHLFNFIIIS